MPIDTVQFEKKPGGFLLVVQPSGWRNQALLLIPAIILLVLAGLFSRALLNGFKINDRPAKPVEVVYSVPVWLGGLAFLATAVQRANRKTFFFADGQSFVVSTVGPLRNTARAFPRASVAGAVVGFSRTEVMGRRLKQLKLLIHDKSEPYRLLTDREDGELENIARHVNENLLPAATSEVHPEFMQVRFATIHQSSFTTICAIALVLGLISWGFAPVIGMGAVGLIFFGVVLGAIVVASIVLSRCKCPRCSAVLKRDQMSPEGHMQYTCRDCGVVWESPVRAGGG